MHHIKTRESASLKYEIQQTNGMKAPQIMTTRASEGGASMRASSASAAMASLSGPALVAEAGTTAGTAAGHILVKNHNTVFFR